MRPAIAAFLLASLCGCSTMSTQMRPDAYYSVAQADEPDESLFAGGAAALAAAAATGRCSSRERRPGASRRVVPGIL